MRLWLRTAILMVFSSVLLAPAGATAFSTSGALPLEFLHAGPVGGPADVHQIVDRKGRQVLLRGVNVDGLADYYRSDLRISYPIAPARYAGGACPRDDRSVEGVVVCERDFAQMRRLGYDAIRLNLSWSLLEPAPGRVDRRYLDR